MQVPPQSQYPDYWQIIAKPISFQLVRVSLFSWIWAVQSMQDGNELTPDTLTLSLDSHFLRSIFCKQSRLKNRNYQTIEKFKDDVNLIFENAQLYNEDGSQIWQDAQQMRVSFIDLLSVLSMAIRSLITRFAPLV